MVLQCSGKEEPSKLSKSEPLLVKNVTFFLRLLANFVLDDLALELPHWHVGDHILELLRRPARDIFRLALLFPKEVERCCIS